MKKCLSVWIALAAAGGALCATAASAGGAPGSDRESFTAGTHTSYRTWTIEESTETGTVSREVRQAVSRMHSALRLTEDVDLLVSFAGGMGQDRSDIVSEVRGVGDLQLMTIFSAVRDRLLLTVGANVPTGRTGSSPEELRALLALSPPALGFRMRQLGEGWDVHIGAASGVDVAGGWTLGGGASYRWESSYELDSTTSYDAGGEVAVTVGADLRRGRIVASADVVYRLFFEDQVEGGESIREGDQLEMSLTGGWSGSRAGFEWYVRDVVKAASDVVPGPLASETSVSNGNNLWFGLSPGYRLARTVRVSLPFDFVAIEQSQQQGSGTSAFAIGAQLGVNLTPVTSLRVRASRLSGEQEDGTADLSGWDTVLALGWRI